MRQRIAFECFFFSRNSCFLLFSAILGGRTTLLARGLWQIGTPCLGSSRLRVLFPIIFPGSRRPLLGKPAYGTGIPRVTMRDDCWLFISRNFISCTWSLI